MEIGYITKKNTILSQTGEQYIEEVRRYLTAAQAARTFRASILRAVVVCSLGFYCLAKSYSFFTGANHLHSIISPGVPGRILSAGLILPLNVAVGFVVCCTMYSFYMYFQRGEL